MRTKTLLLLAVGCGLVILLAGGIQLLRVGGQEQSATLLGTGQPGKAGDVTVEAGGVVRAVGDERGHRVSAVDHGGTERPEVIERTRQWLDTHD